MASVTSKIKIDPKVKDVLVLLGAGTFLAASIVFPGLPVIAKGAYDLLHESEKQKRAGEWEKFNQWRLKQVIKRMQSAKYIEIDTKTEIPKITITKKGSRRLLQFNVDSMILDETNWDGKWRLIIYDVKTEKRQNSEQFRKSLNKLKLLKLQRSVYLTPFKCEDHIEYLRILYDVGNEVVILKVKEIENELAYRKYFGV